MKEERKLLQYRTKANDVDEKGIVTVAVNGIGIKDSQGDISQPGSFTKTLKENIARMRWFLNHRTDQLLGVPLEGKEEGGNLVMVGKLNLDKQIGRDILADYKLYAENGRTLEHSIGVQAVKRDTADPARVLEWKMYEYSTLTSWGSNPQTFLVDIKSATADRIREAMDFIKQAVRQKYSDKRLKTLEMKWDLLNKALAGGNIVTCPYCGHDFDYDEQKEYTYPQQVIDAAMQYGRWMTDNAVADEMEKLRPEIREQVSAIIDSIKAAGKKYEEKSITDMMAYVRCPHCWSRIYRATLGSPQPASGNAEPSGDTQDDTEGEMASKAATGTFYEQFNGCFNS